MIRLLELGSLGTYAGASLAASVMATPPDWLQLGALGIVGFMVFQNYRQNREMRQLIAEKDARLERRAAEARQTNEDYNRVQNRLCEVLEDRPCLVDDQRIKSNPEGG